MSLLMEGEMPRQSKPSINKLEAELAEEKRLFTQLCGDHEKLAMEAQLLRAELAHWKLLYKDAIGDTSS